MGDAAALQEAGEQSMDEDAPPTVEKIACDRCRYRKIRCDRKHPCSTCARKQLQCLYPHRPQPKEKKQRIFISEVYEKKIDDISRKLEEFGQVLGRHLNESPAFKAKPSASASPRPFLGGTSEPDAIVTPKSEYEGESSMAAHAVFANRFFQETVGSTPARDMAVILETLRLTFGSQKHDNDPEMLYPHAKTLPPGSSARDLPMPPVEASLACLRMAKSCKRVQFLWPQEYAHACEFHSYFIKVFTPGECSHADLVIVYSGLYWLYVECKAVVKDPEQEALYDSYIIMCRDGLETVLAGLPFHLPTTLDSVLALSTASFYCVEMFRPSAAWSLIEAALHMSHILGLHSALALANDDAELKARKTRIFWSTYVIEKALSLRLGRSSTIRDADTTVPYPEFRDDFSFNSPLPRVIGFARLQGRVYDEIYSPGALNQPDSVRVSRAEALLRDLDRLVSEEGPAELRYIEVLRQSVDENHHNLFRRGDRITVLSLGCLIYRSIPAEPGSSTVFSPNCIASAREALEEHQKAMSLIDSIQDEDMLEPYINWALLQSPFVPFIVLFCHVVETANTADLERLGAIGGLVDTLVGGSLSVSCLKQLKLFRVLYDVACSYVKLRTQDAPPGQHIHRNSSASGSQGSGPQQQQQPRQLTHTPPLPTSAGLQQAFAEWDAANSSQEAAGIAPPGIAPPGIMDGQGYAPAGFAGGVAGVPQQYSMEIEPQGAQLGNWLYMNHQFMRALEEDYF